MKKWLVGLLAASLCAASAWADSVTYTVANKAVTVTDGAAPEGASAAYSQTGSNSGQATSGNSMTLTLSGFDGATITGLTLSMKSNASKGGGSLSATCGDALIAAIEDSKFNSDNWNGAWSADWVDITPEVTATAVDGDVVITIAATENSLYCQSYTIEYTMGDPQFSVKFDKENWFKVKLGEESSVTAIAQHGVEPYTYSWSCDKASDVLTGTDATLAIPDTLEEGDYTLACLVKDDGGEGDAINAIIGFTVEAVPEITGETYTLVESADDFEEGADYLIVSAKEGAFTSALKNEANGTRIALEEVVLNEDNTIVTDSAAIVWQIQAGAEAGQYVLFNEAASVYAAAPKSAGNNAQLVEDGSDALAQWTLDFSALPAVKIMSVAYPDRYLQRNSSAGTLYFAAYASAQATPSLYKAESGPAKFSIKLDPPKDFEVEEGTEGVTVTATPKNAAEGAVTYSWAIDGTPVDATGNSLLLDTSAPGGPHEVTCVATDAADATAEARVSYTVTAPAVKYAITVDVDIANGSIAADKTEAEADELVTLTATPAGGYKLGTYLLEGEAISGNTFNMPAKDVVVSATFVEKPVVAGFTKITSLDELTEGEYVLVGSDTNGAYGAVAELTGSTKVLSAAAVTIEDDTVVDAEESQIWTLAKVADGWTIYNEALGFLGYSGSQNSAMAETESSEKSTWTFSVAEGELFKVANVGTEGRTLRYNYNKGNMRFACYTSDTLPNIGLYKGESGPAKFSIKLDPAKDFEVEQGTEGVTVTATPKNAAEGNVTYEWMIDGTPVDATGDSLLLDTSVVGGPHKVTCVATDAAEARAEAHVAYTVTPPVVKYTITVDGSIANGSIAADKTEAEANELVTLTATPAGGYKLETYLLDGEAISGNTFPMPAKPVVVSATFVEKPAVSGFAKITSLDELTEGEYVITGAKAAGEEYAMKASIAGTSTKYIERREDAVKIEEDTVTDAEDSIIWTLAQGEKGWTIYNEAIGYAAYVASGNSSGSEAKPSEKSSWTITESETAGLFMVNNVDKDGRYLLYNSGSPRFACYTNVSSGKALAFYKGESGPAKFSVSFDKKDGFEVPFGTADSITATAKNGSGDYSYVWTGDLTGEGATLEIPATLEAKSYTVTVKATDNGAEGVFVEKSISFTVAEPVVKYPITVERVPGGTLSVDKDEAEAGETVTVTATPDPGMKLESITFNGTPISGKTFTMPAEAVTVSGSFVERTGVVYTLVESADDFEAGAEYVVVAYSKDKFTSALKNEASGTRIGVEEVVITEENTVLVDSDAIVWQIKAGAAEGQYVLFNEAKGVYAAATKDDNVAQLLTDGTDALAQWTLKFSDLPKVAIGSVAYPERQLNRNSTATYEYFATYKGSGTQPYLFKRAGAPSPKITYTGATTVKLGGTFKLDFVLKNYSETYSWKVQGAGEITSAGAYSYTPSAVGTTVIKVQALDAGKNVIAQTEDITLTTEEADPDQPKVTCNLGTEVAGSAGQEFTFVFTAENFTPVDAWVVSVNGEDVQENYDPAQSETFEWTPDADGTYTIVATTYSDSGELTCTVTATIGGTPGPGPGGAATITKIEVDTKNGQVVLTTDGTTVKSSASLVAPDWQPCAEKGSGVGTVTVPISGKIVYFKAEK